MKELLKSQVQCAVRLESRVRLANRAGGIAFCPRLSCAFQLSVRFVLRGEVALRLSLKLQSGCNVALAACQRARRWALALCFLEVPVCLDLRSYNSGIAAWSTAPESAAAAAALQICLGLGDLASAALRLAPARWLRHYVPQVANRTRPRKVRRLRVDAWSMGEAVVLHGRLVLAQTYGKMCFESSFTWLTRPAPRHVMSRVSSGFMFVYGQRQLSERLREAASCELKVDAVGATAAVSASPRWRSSLHCVATLRLSRSGCEPDTTLLNAAITSCSAASQWQPALQILHDLVSPSSLRRPDIVTCNTVIVACGRAEQGSRTMKVLAQLETSSLRPNTITVNSLLSACDARGDWERACSLLQRYRRRNVEADSASVTPCLGATARSSQWLAARTLLAACGHAGVRNDRHTEPQRKTVKQRLSMDRYDAAMQYQVLFERWGFKESVGILAGSRGFAWNTAWLCLSDMGAAVLDWTDQWETSAALWELLRSRGLEPTTELWNSVLASGPWQRALLRLRAAQSTQLADQAVAWVRSWLRALSLLDESRRGFHGGEDTMVAFNTAMSCSENVETWTRCLHLLHQLQEARTHSDQKSYRSPIRMAGHGLCWELAAKLYVHMVRCRIPDADASALSAAVWAAEAAEAAATVARLWPAWQIKATTGAVAKELPGLAKLQRKALRGAWRQFGNSNSGTSRDGASRLAGTEDVPPASRSGLGAAAAQHFSAAYPPMAPPRRNPGRGGVV
eukprot:s2538_g15.t1